MDHSKEAKIPHSTNAMSSSPVESRVEVVNVEVKESKGGFGGFGGVADLIVKLQRFSSAHTLSAKENDARPPMVPRPMASKFETPTWREFAGDWR